MKNKRRNHSAQFKESVVFFKHVFGKSQVEFPNKDYSLIK